MIHNSFAAFPAEGRTATDRGFAAITQITGQSRQILAKMEEVLNAAAVADVTLYMKA